MKFLLVDDHTLIREALRGVLSELDGGATILEASRWSDAARLLEEHPDLALVLLDLGLPDRKGFAALEEARARHPKIPIVILSGTCDREHVEKALNLGAVGFIPKSGEREVMLSALRLVFSGGVYIPPEILSRPETPNGLAHSAAAGGRRADGSLPAVPADLGLTARQIDVLALMMRGKSNKAICRILNLAEPTVKNHVTAILKALKASNRTEAVVLVGELGWDLPQLEGVGLDRRCRRRVACRRIGRAVLPQYPVHGGAQGHRRDRLLQQLVAARLGLLLALDRNVAGDQKGGNRRSKGVTQALDDRDAGFAMGEVVVGDDEIRLAVQLEETGQGGARRASRRIRRSPSRAATRSRHPAPAGHRRSRR